MDKITKKAFNAILFFGMLFSLSQNIPGPLIPEFVREFGIGYDIIGAIFFAGLFFGMAATVIFGNLADRFSKKLIILAGCAIVLGGFTGIIFSTGAVSFALSYIILFFGFGTLETGMMTGVAELAGSSRSHAFTVFTGFMGWGGFIGPILLFVILYFGLRWRTIFIITAFFIVLLFIVFLRAGYPKRSISGTRYRISLLKLLKNPVTIIGAAALIFHNGTVWIMISWLTTYLTHFNISTGYGSLVVSVFFLSIIIGRVLTRRIIQRYDEKIFIITAVIVSTVLLYSIIFAEGVIIKIILTFILGISSGGLFPILLSIVFSADSQASGKIFSILGFFGYGSGMLFQLVTGLVAERFGEEAVIYIPAVNIVMCCIFIALLVGAARRAETRKG